MSIISKADLCEGFLRGASIADLANFYGLHRLTVETTLREGFTGLANFNHRLMTGEPQVPPVGTTTEDPPPDAIPMPAEPVSTEIEAQPI